MTKTTLQHLLNYKDAMSRKFISITCLLFILCFCFKASIFSGNFDPKIPLKKLPQLYVPKKENCEIPLVDMPIKKIIGETELIIIDAGHGGHDYGTHSLGVPKYHEKYLNLSTAELVKRFLQQFGYQVIMTRTDDTFISLEDRAAFANKLNAKLFVSIHYNSAPSKDAEGIEVFYYRLDDDKTRVAKSKELARTILSRTTQNTQAGSRGVKHGNYAVIREAKMPAVLIEGGFLTNEEEMKKIKNPAYMKQLALGIAQGVQDYLAKEKLFLRQER